MVVGIDKPHKDLDVWKMSMELCRDVYKISKILPDEEKYGLTSQIKRAVISIPSNIAEGAARNSKKEFIQFLSIAQGSLAELETQLVLCCHYLDLIPEEKLTDIFVKMERISKMITGLKKSLRGSYK
jgi:four helix bundle protein